MMLELLPDGWEDGPMVLLGGGGAADVDALREVFRHLAARVGLRAAFHELPFMNSVADAGLIGVSSHERRGVVLSSQPSRSEWILSPSLWDNAEGLLEPFGAAGEESRTGYQFLDQGVGMPVIYSTSRSW